MEDSGMPNKVPDDVSSDGEEDFESADEGEGKGKDKVASTGATQQMDILKDSKKSKDDESSATSVVRSNKAKNYSKAAKDSSADDIENLSPVVLVKDSELAATENQPGRPVVTNENLEVETKSTDEKSSESLCNPPECGSSGSWGNWGSWGAVFNQATASVTSGLSHVIEKVETTLGIPEPGELDEMVSTDEKKEVITTEPKSAEIDRGEENYAEGSSKLVEGDKEKSESFLTSWGLTSLSNAVTSKGLELVSEGIDALEVIGKKTMNVIAEGDPGLRSRRAMFEKPTLSQVLREAKEKSAKEAAERRNQEVLEKVNFSDEFDRYQGLAHLEALEILSRECEGKIESLLIDLFEGNLEEAKSKLRDIEYVFKKESQSEEEKEEREGAEFAVEVGKCAMALNLAFVPDKLNQTEEAVTKWLEECVKDQEKSPRSRSADDIYSHVITSLASITAKSIEVFRKVAEMILLTDEEKCSVSAEDRAMHLSTMTKVVTDRISSLSSSYAQCLNTAVEDVEDNDNITPVITEVYLECSNSSSHIQDAFKLLLPVLQVSALNDLKKNLE